MVFTVSAPMSGSIIVQVAVSRVLGAGTRPQRTLHPGASALQRGKTLAAESLFEVVVCQFGVGNSGFTQ